MMDCIPGTRTLASRLTLEDYSGILLLQTGALWLNTIHVAAGFRLKSAEREADRLSQPLSILRSINSSSTQHSLN